MLPKVIESAAATQITQNWPGTLITKTMRNKTANAAALGAVDIKPTIGAGAPSYTSGVQTWNGAAATLNPRPTNINATATNASKGIGAACSDLLIRSMLVDPVAPNINATPYRKNAVANDPSRKYFSDASALLALMPPESRQAHRGDGRDFERDENQNQFHCRRHQRHADRAEQNQCVIFPRANPLHRHVFVRAQNHDGRDRNHQNVKENAESIHLYHVPERQSRSLRHDPRRTQARQRPDKRDHAQNFLPLSSSSNGSSTITIMPKTDRTISGRMRM